MTPLNAHQPAPVDAFCSLSIACLNSLTSIHILYLHHLPLPKDWENTMTTQKLWQLMEVLDMSGSQGIQKNKNEMDKEQKTNLLPSGVGW